MPSRYNLSQGILEITGSNQRVDKIAGISGELWWARCSEHLELQPTRLFIYDSDLGEDIGCTANIKYDNGWFYKSDPDTHCNQLMTERGCYYLRYENFTQSTGFFRFEDSVVCIGLKHGPSSITAGNVKNFLRLYALNSADCGYLANPFYSEKESEFIPYSYFIVKRNEGFTLLTPLAVSLGFIFHGHPSPKTVPVAVSILHADVLQYGVFTGLDFDANGEFWHLPLKHFVASSASDLKTLITESPTVFYDAETPINSIADWTSSEDGNCSLVYAVDGTMVTRISKTRPLSYCESVTLQSLIYYDVANEIYVDDRTSWYSELFVWLEKWLFSFFRKIFGFLFKFLLSHIGFELFYYLLLGWFTQRITGNFIVSAVLCACLWLLFGDVYS